MEYAAAIGSAVFTNDLDFGSTLALTNAREPSVVKLRTDELDPLIIGSRLTAIVFRLRNELEQGALVTVEES